LLGQTASANGLLPTAGMFSISKNKKEKKCIHSIYIEAINSYLSGLEKKKKKSLSSHNFYPRMVVSNFILFVAVFFYLFLWRPTFSPVFLKTNNI
jgi:hypothetical protein